MVNMILLCLILAVVFFALYQSGFMVINAKSAVTYVGSSGGNAARFVGCSGYIKRIVRFRAEGTYTFLLDAELSKGDMAVELLDGTKQRVLYLEPGNPGGHVTVRKSKKYYLVIHFKSATGRYSLIRT